jgi:hypothetical protein
VTSEQEPEADDHAQDTVTGFDLQAWLQSVSRTRSRRSSPVAAWTIRMWKVLDQDDDAGSGVGSADADGVEPAAVDRQPLR